MPESLRCARNSRTRKTTSRHSLSPKLWWSKSTSSLWTTSHRTRNKRPQWSTTARLLEVPHKPWSSTWLTLGLTNIPSTRLLPRSIISCKRQTLKSMRKIRSNLCASWKLSSLNYTNKRRLFKIGRLKRPSGSRKSKKDSLRCASIKGLSSKSRSTRRLKRRRQPVLSKRMTRRTRWCSRQEEEMLRDRRSHPSTIKKRRNRLRTLTRLTCLSSWGWRLHLTWGQLTKQCTNRESTSQWYEYAQFVT